MKKKAIIIGGGGLVVVAGAALAIVSMSGVPKKPPDYESIRGTEAYYSGPKAEYDLPDFMGNLKGAQAQRVVKVGLTIEYRLGPEISDANAIFSTRKAAIMDCLHRVFANKTVDDVEGSERKDLLKEEVRAQLQTILFPDKKGRIEGVLYRDFFVQ
jgi:flagellar basal body-associated protein FliL